MVSRASNMVEAIIPSARQCFSAVKPDKPGSIQGGRTKKGDS